MKATPRPRTSVPLKGGRHALIRRAGPADAEWHDLKIDPSSPYAGDWIEFEIINLWKAMYIEGAQ
ncbi:MAG: hypothetical protein HY748_13680 [Elusimicrobia bacterium]|nr:hypothetical protein [Elusimicrobiota bacterium]